MFGKILRKYEEKIISVIAQPFMELNPNLITSFSTIFAFLAFLAGLLHNIKALFVFSLFSFTMDLIDGTVAKKTGRKTLFGNYYDAMCDRIVEFFIYLGIFFMEPLLSLIVIGLSFLVSYAKARLAITIPADNHDWPALGDRFDRTTTLTIGLFLAIYFPIALKITLYILATILTIGFIQRLFYAEKLIKKYEESENGEREKNKKHEKHTKKSEKPKKSTERAQISIELIFGSIVILLVAAIVISNSLKLSSQSKEKLNTNYNQIKSELDTQKEQIEEKYILESVNYDINKPANNSYINENPLTISWSSDWNEFYFEISDNENFSHIIFSDFVEKNVTLNLDENKTYYWRITPSKNGKLGITSETMIFHTDYTPPSAGTISVNQSGNLIFVTWEKPQKEEFQAPQSPFLRYRVIYSNSTEEHVGCIKEDWDTNYCYISGISSGDYNFSVEICDRAMNCSQNTTQFHVS